MTNSYEGMAESDPLVVRAMLISDFQEVYFANRDMASVYVDHRQDRLDDISVIAGIVEDIPTQGLGLAVAMHVSFDGVLKGATFLLGVDARPLRYYFDFFSVNEERMDQETAYRDSQFRFMLGRTNFNPDMSRAVRERFLGAE